MSKEAYYNLGEAYFSVSDIDYAMEAYESSLKIDSQYLPSINHLAYCYSHKGRHKEALEYFQKYLSKNPGANAYDSYGDGLMTAGILDSAEGTKLEGIKINPDLDYIHTGLGYIRLLQNSFEAAEQSFNTYLLLAQKDSSNEKNQSFGLVDKAYLYTQMGKLQMARDTCIKALDLWDSDKLNAFNFNAHWLLANIYFQEKDVDRFNQKLDLFESIIDSYSLNSVNYHQTYKFCMHLRFLKNIQLGDYEAAYSIADEFINEIGDKVKDWSSPFDRAYFSNEFAKRFAETENFKQSVKFYFEAIDYNPNYSPAITGLEALINSRDRKSEKDSLLNLMNANIAERLVKLGLSSF